MQRRRAFKRRPTLRESLESSKRAQDFYAAMSGKPAPANVMLQAMRPKRTRAAPRRNHSRPLERDVLKAIMQALRLDRRVASVDRNQSGLFQEGNRMVRVGHRGKPDLTVFLRDGRYVSIEVKRDEQEKPKPHQLERLQAIRESGGLAGWAWSIESALELLP